MGKTVKAVIGLVAAVAIAVVAPMLAPLALGVLGIAATATAIAVATAVIGLTLAAGLSLAMGGARALGVGAPSARSAVGPPQIFRQSISNSFIVYGKRRLGGLLVFFHAAQSGDDHYRYFVIACAGHRCAGMTDFMLGDEIVTVNGAGMVTSGKYASAAWLWFQRGLASETANATFVSECGGNWTSAHKGNGVAAIYAKFKMTEEVVQAGMPNITVIAEGRDEILDPRDATEKYTANAALVFYDWLQMPREEGGFGAAADEIPDDAFISAQANVCDEEPETGFNRYELNGVIQTGAAPNEIRDVMVVNMAGSYTYSGGKHLMRPGYWVPVSEILEESDLAGPIQVSPFAAADAAANEVQGTFINPADGYQGAPFGTQKLASPPVDVRQVDLDLAFTTYRGQAERVARIMLNRAQADKTVIASGNINWLRVKALSTVQLNVSRYNLDNYAFNVANWSMSADFGVVLSLSEENEDIYDPPTISAPTTPPVIVSPDPLITPSQLIELISNSSVSGLTFSISDAGAVTISNHSRIYSDKTASVTGTAGTPHATAGATGDRLYIFYDDAARSGGAVIYQHVVLAGGTGDPSSAFPSSAHPGRHMVLTGLVPAAAGTTTGGSDVGSGGGAPTPYCVTIDSLILMADGTEKPAGDLEFLIGKLLLTRHENTLEWGSYPIEAVAIARDEPVLAIEIGGKRLRGTPGHRLFINGAWRTMTELGGRPDGVADVAKISVTEAHTYVSNGLLSHNIKMTEP